MQAKSTTRKSTGKGGKKPREDKPPFKHQSGRWCKKVRGQLVYLGAVASDPDGERAARIWKEQHVAIRAGRRPVLDAGVSVEGVTVKHLCDAFLEAKEGLLATGELAQRSWDDYHATCLRVADAFGRNRLVSDLRPIDFTYLRGVLAKGRGLVTLKNEIARVRILFRWGFESETTENAARFGVSFKPPTSKSLRIARREKGAREFQQADLRRIIDAAKVPLKAMVLLGINAGLGNSDCARLRMKHLDLKAGWLDFPRPKTGVERRCPLWAETIKSLKEAIAERPTPKSDAHHDLVFITKYGAPWRADHHRNSPLSHEFAKVLDDLGLKRPGLNFYALRHTLQTKGEGALDAPALARMMGHAPEASDMASTYRESIDDARLLAVSRFVHTWLFPPTKRGRKAR